MGSQSLLRAVESELATHRTFGHWHSILNRSLTFYLKAIRHLGERSQTATQLYSTLTRSNDPTVYRVLTDPVVCSCITSALEAFKRGDPIDPAEVDAIFAETNRLIKEPSVTRPLQAIYGDPSISGIGPYRAYVWTQNGEPGTLPRAFQRLFERQIANNVSAKKAVLCSPSLEMFSVLSEGVELLCRVLPNLTESVLPHVQVLAIIDIEKAGALGETHWPGLAKSLSSHAVPGAIFLSAASLENPYVAAESILHEAVHKKASDLSLTRSILRAGYSPDISRSITIPWNKPLPWNPNVWPVDRALLAFHVYVHLAVFFTELTIRPKLYSVANVPLSAHVGQLAEQSFDRARYLSKALNETASGHLGDDGHAFLGWLNATLHRLEPTRPQFCWRDDWQVRGEF